MDRSTDTRERLLAEAQRLFAQRGFGGATTADIARHAGVAEGSIYHHFKDKKALFMACVEPLVEEVLRMSSADLSSARSRRDAVRSIVESRLRLIESNMERFNILFAEAPYRQDLYEMLYGRMFLAWGKEFSGSGLDILGSGSGGRPVDFLILGLGITTVIWTTLNFLKLRGKSDSAEYQSIPAISREDLVDGITDFVLNGLGGGRGACENA